jgi:hypothetical protein
MFSGIESGLIEVLVGHLKVRFHGGSCTGTRLVSARTPDQRQHGADERCTDREYHAPATTDGSSATRW